MASLRCFLCTIACIVAGAAPAFAEEWVEYKPEGGGFRLELPGAPKTVGNGFAVLQNHDASCSLTHIPVDDGDAGNPEPLLDRISTAVVPRNEVRSVERLTIGSSPARRIVSEWDTTVVSTTLAVVHDAQLIEVICSESAPQVPSATVARIFRSFALIER